MITNDLIDAFGGTTAMARIFDVLPSAVSNWRAAGQFPARLHLRILREAQLRGIEIPDSIFDMTEAA